MKSRKKVSAQVADAILSGKIDRNNLLIKAARKSRQSDWNKDLDKAVKFENSALNKTKGY